MITTQAAEKIVNDVISKIRLGNICFDVYRSRAQVACLASVSSVVEELKASGLNLKRYDLVIIPGLMRGSAKVIEKEFGVRAVKGTLYAGDLPQMIKALLEGVDFSPDLPADVVLKDKVLNSLKERVRSEIENKEPLFWLGRVKFVIDPPPMVLLYEHMIGREDDLEELSDYLRRNGVEGVIVGCESGCKVDKAVRAVDWFREKGFIVGLDVQDFREVSSELIDASDILMNVDEDVIEWLSGRIGSNQGLVLIPSNSENMLGSLTRAVKKAFSIGLTKIVVDPLIRPPMLGFAGSIERFLTSKRNIKLPHMFGMPNFYELMDADTHGVISSLMSLSFEFGASVVLLTESSHKAKGAVKEAYYAREMTYRAFVRRSPPLDVGVDLLIVKEKSRRHIPPPSVDVHKTISVPHYIPYDLDPNHYLKIYIDVKKGEIVVDVHNARTHEVKARFRGTNPLSIGRAVVNEFSLPPSHALYLGFELSKAEIALRLKKSYMQDEPVISFKY